MSIPPAARSGPLPPHRRLYRSGSERWIAGVCGGIAEHLRVDVRAVRVVTAALALTGAGVAAYLALWVLVPQQLDEPVPGPPGTPGDGPRIGRDGSEGRGRSVGNGGNARHGGNGGPAGLGGFGGLGWLVVGGLAALAIGAVWSVQWIGAGQLARLLPLLAIVAGAVIAWSQLDETERRRWSEGTGERTWLTIARVVAGAALAAVGVLTLATGSRGLAGIWDVVLAALAVLLGALVVVAPWGYRLWRGLQREQAERVRATERADIAAHLHDSVLQTLALIQRTADNPQEVSRLARSQERELRSWLYGGVEGPPATIAAAFRAAAIEIEALHGTPIDVVVAGDVPLDDRGTALVAAAREAMLNAVRHGEPPVSAFLEVGAGSGAAFVRDHGSGFDPDEIATDRLGVRESIIGRMDRHGGSAHIKRLDAGTEVVLTLPIDATTRHTESVRGEGE